MPLDRGESSVVTRNGVVVGDLAPARPRRFVDAGTALSAFASAPPIDSQRFRDELDGLLVVAVPAPI